MRRRRVIQCLAGLGSGVAIGPGKTALGASCDAGRFEIRYVLASALFGGMKLEEIVPQVGRAGAVGLDIWGKPHGTQREELDQIGVEKLEELLHEHKTELLVSSRYPLGPFGLQKEMPVLKELGGKVIVCGATGPKDPTGKEAERAVRIFLEKMKPHADLAGEHGQVIAVENHANQLLSHPDSIRSFAELNNHPALGVAFAPHHLHEFTGSIPGLIRELGNENLPFIYFQEHGIGSKETVAKEIELEQLPGRGKLDYVPIIRALRDIEFGGLAEIFMHPTPRGLPMLESAEAIVATINESRNYIDQCVAKLS